MERFTEMSDQRGLWKVVLIKSMDSHNLQNSQKRFLGKALSAANVDEESGLGSS